jgi:hypothetical protein
MYKTVLVVCGLFGVAVVAHANMVLKLEGTPQDYMIIGTLSFLLVCVGLMMGLALAGEFAIRRRGRGMRK